ncbi:MAG TPA: lysophospholipid acyltransferase family protein [Anaerolineales bacterium]|nr:lysophospholipid acyltransferase family protein [Anaerolineales bacterium]
MPVKKYHLAWWRRWLARPLIRLLLGSLFRLLAPVRITGRKNVPLGKPYILAINHVSLFDPPFAGVFWPEQVEALGASDVWDRPGQNVLARLWGGIPVHRGEYDRAAMEAVINALRGGYPLLIAPEGGRSHAPGLRKAMPGVAYIAEQSGMPVIPVGIVGTTDDFFSKAIRGKRPQLEMHIGKPLQLPPVEGKGEMRHASRQSNADLVMRTIAGLLPEGYRGVYSGSAIVPDAQS